MQDFFHENEDNSTALRDRIAAACEGLIYVSEMDAPVTAFFGSTVSAVTGEIILQQMNLSGDTPVVETDFNAFFEWLAGNRDWYGEAEKLRAKKYSELHKLLGDNLIEPKVFRVGLVQLDILAVGIDSNGHLLGITTKAVET